MEIKRKLKIGICPLQLPNLPNFDLFSILDFCAENQIAIVAKPFCNCGVKTNFCLWQTEYDGVIVIGIVVKKKNLWQVEYDGVGDDWNDEASRGELLPASGDLILFGFCFL